MNMEQFQRPLIVVYYKLDFTGKRKKETSYWRNRFASMNHKSKYIKCFTFTVYAFITML